MSSLRTFLVRWMHTAFAVLTLALLLVMTATQAHGMTHTLVLRFDQSHPPPGSTVGVLANSIPVTSAPLPVVPSSDGLYHVGPVAIQYGATITVQILTPAGVLSDESNAQVYEGCYWDRTGDGIVSLADFGDLRASIYGGTANAAELESFKRAFGMECPAPPSIHLHE